MSRTLQRAWQSLLRRVGRTGLIALALLIPTAVIALAMPRLDRQTDELRQAYAPWCALDVADSEDGWVLMTATDGAAR